MRLARLLEKVELNQEIQTPDLEITGVTYDSRTVIPGTLFVAMKGSKTDGNSFVEQALGKGAVAVISAIPQPPEFRAPWI